MNENTKFRLLIYNNDGKVIIDRYLKSLDRPSQYDQWIQGVDLADKNISIMTNSQTTVVIVEV